MDFRHFETELRSHISAMGLAMNLAPNIGRYMDETADLKAYVKRYGGVQAIAMNQAVKAELARMLGVAAQELDSEMPNVAARPEPTRRMALGEIQNRGNGNLPGPKKF